MTRKLLDLPLFGTTARASRPFPVFSKRAEEDGNFTLDRGRMVKVEQDVDAHVAAGGVLCLFPEGQLSRSGDMRKLQSFRELARGALHVPIRPGCYHLSPFRELTS
jgi:1-acyl-sn-glycerol-3-phosphate acyltransferase